MPEIPERPDIRPMSPGASRLFVIACIVIIIGAAFGSAWYLTRSAFANRDRVEANTEQADSTAVRGFGVTEY